jgi:hypothetical protein
MSLGGNAIVPAAGVLLPAWLADSDWKKRHATLICLAQIAEGCNKVMAKQLGPLTDMCLTGLQDSHPKVRNGGGKESATMCLFRRRIEEELFKSCLPTVRSRALSCVLTPPASPPSLSCAQVRWAACQALGQMCTDLGPDLQDNHHAKLLPALMALMDDFNNPRVQVSSQGLGFSHELGERWGRGDVEGRRRERRECRRAGNRREEDGVDSIVLFHLISHSHLCSSPFSPLVSSPPLHSGPCMRCHGQLC